MRGSNDKFRRAVFAAHQKMDERGVYLICGDCGCRIDPARERWDADHVLCLSAGGADDAGNGQPLCKLCHRRKTATKDIPKGSKSRRVSEKHFGIKRKSGFYRPPGYKHQWDRRDE